MVHIACNYTWMVKYNNMVSNTKNVVITYLESLLYPLGITIEQVDSSIDEGILFQILKRQFKFIQIGIDIRYIFDCLIADFM